MNEAQKSYFSDLFNTKANTVKQLWNNLASVASLSKSKNKSNINKLLINNNRITDPKMISDLFNNYFCTVGETLQKNINFHTANTFKSYLPPSIQQSMFCTPTTNTEILKIVNKFKANKSDNIGTRLLKEVTSSIIQSLLHIFNMSFTSGVVPTSLLGRDLRSFQIHIRIRIGRLDSIRFESDGPIRKFRIAAPATFAVVS